MQVSISTPTEAQNEQLSPQHPTAIDFYELAVSNDETIASNYWHLGVAYLLAGREDDAQAAWFTPLATATDLDIDNLTNDLIGVLERTALDLAKIPDLEQAWLLRQHLWNLAPDRVENVLYLIYLASKIGTLTTDSLIDWQVNKLLQEKTIDLLDEDLLERVLGSLIKIDTDPSLEIITTCLQGLTSNRATLIDKIANTLFEVFNQQPATGAFAIALAQLCNSLQPDTLSTLQLLNYLYSGVGLYHKAIETAEQYYQLTSSSLGKLFASYQLQRTHFTAGNWKDKDRLIDRHRQLLAEVIQSSPSGLDRHQYQSLAVSSFFLPYAEDNPRINKSLQNQLVSIYQQNVRQHIQQKIAATDIAESFITESSLPKQVGCLRIGYISIGLKGHSVGWLSRWLIHHHDRQSFQIFLYCLNSSETDEFNHQWFRDKADITSYLNCSYEQIIAQIEADKIDILIDLDSVTYDMTCLVMAHKPAPVQVSWLGWDSAGIPTVDYFIADPYVLADDAQDYYSEKIWRLPQTYLAIDGFEIGTPTLRREDLDIPADAIVYLSSQSGYKRHPDCVRAQMQIIKAVPNSYFLIKGRSDGATIQSFFGELAAEVGISLDRLRFLERDIDEYTHRANLAIADVVLDTFPYNGATTTLETLWMGIPLVTQVGQQFAARNSYTFMLNAGIEEGIAWNQDEYIEWGIKLGLDRDLRNKIHGKLRSGRTTAPVWNGKQFTRDLEQAYRQMWAIYQEQQQELNSLN
jgi:predicted O-linked N-acetylglucosamine transferase (SPINDLY family)